MLKFIRKLYSAKKGNNRTVIILNDDGTEEYTSHKFKPRNLRLLSVAALIGIIVLVVFLIRFTPLGGFVFNRQELRQSVIKMQKQVALLQNSMRARKMQLQNLRQTLFSGKDSVFMKTKVSAKRSVAGDNYAASPVLISDFQLPGKDAVISSLLNVSTQFPAPWPVDGTITRRFSSNSGHYGLDIAADKGEYFYAIANGVVVGVNRSLNYGNVLYIQHNNGILTVYKHASEIVPEVGDIISAGDVLGRIGDTGILSSGPHLHMEIWADGIPQHPLHYLIKLE